MERLTTKNVSGHWIVKTEISNYDAFDRLAAYEDTGLDPEEIMELLELSGELMKILIPQTVEWLRWEITKTVTSAIDLIREFIDDLEVNEDGTADI